MFAPSTTALWQLLGESGLLIITQCLTRYTQTMIDETVDDAKIMILHQVNATHPTPPSHTPGGMRRALESTGSQAAPVSQGVQYLDTNVRCSTGPNPSATMTRTTAGDMRPGYSYDLRSSCKSTVTMYSVDQKARGCDMRHMAVVIFFFPEPDVPTQISPPPLPFDIRYVLCTYKKHLVGDMAYSPGIQ